LKNEIIIGKVPGIEDYYFEDQNEEAQTQCEIILSTKITIKRTIRMRMNNS